MSDEYGEAADDEREKAERVDPVGDTYQGRMPWLVQNA
jgi:hypothetical protein